MQGEVDGGEVVRRFDSLRYSHTVISNRSKVEECGSDAVRNLKSTRAVLHLLLKV